MAVTALLLFAVVGMHWAPQPSHTTAGLRGLSVVSGKVAWATGTGGTVLETVDGGATWQTKHVAGGERLDFRDVAAFDGRTALIVSSGAGDLSRVYLTKDGGQTWTPVLKNPNRKGFFDALAFWDRRHGILLGDPVAGRFVIFRTDDGGETWKRADEPIALAGENAFAASGTCVAVRGSRDAWFGTGGPGVARVFYSADRGQSWTAAATPLSGRSGTSGIFSLAFSDSEHGVAVGGDYEKPSERSRTLAVTNDGGYTWRAPRAQIAGGFRSAVVYAKALKKWIAVGTTGSDYSVDGGETWHTLSGHNLNAVDSDGSHVWAVGPKGLILRLETR